MLHVKNIHVCWKVLRAHVLRGLMLASGVPQNLPLKVLLREAIHDDIPSRMPIYARKQDEVPSIPHRERKHDDVGCLSAENVRKHV